jgi:hypothetical protein
VATPFPVMSPLLLSKTVGRRERTISCCTLICSYFPSHNTHTGSSTRLFFFLAPKDSNVLVIIKFNCRSPRREDNSWQYSRVTRFKLLVRLLISWTKVSVLFSVSCNPLVESWHVKLVTGNIALALVVITGLKHLPGDGTITT